MSAEICKRSNPPWVQKWNPVPTHTPVISRQPLASCCYRFVSCELKPILINPDTKSYSLRATAPSRWNPATQHYCMALYIFRPAVQLQRPFSPLPLILWLLFHNLFQLALALFSGCTALSWSAKINVSGKNAWKHFIEAPPHSLCVNQSIRSSSDIWQNTTLLRKKSVWDSVKWSVIKDGILVWVCKKSQ